MQNRIQQLINYLESWNDNGSYRSLIIHRGNLKRISNIHDTPWVQAPIIEAYIELYKNTKNPFYYEKIIEAVEKQCNNISENGAFKNAGHEDDRFSSLVHNALASISLCKFINLIKSDNRCISDNSYLFDKAIKTITSNLKYILLNLPDERTGLFKFDIVDYYQDSSNHFVLNMNALLLELFFLSEEILNKDFSEHTKIIINFLDSYTVGGNIIPYSNIRNEIEIAIYSALVGRGLLSLQMSSKAEDNVNIMLQKIVCSIERLYDSSRNVFYHGRHIFNNDVIIDKYPILLSGSGIIIDFLHDYYKYHNIPKINKLREITKQLFEKYQQKNGGVSNFYGYYTIDNYRKINVFNVWEDSLPTPGWNGFLMKAVIKLFKEDLKGIKEPSKIKTTIKLNKKYIWFENSKYLIIISWFPLLSINLSAYNKKKDKAIFWFDMRRIKGILNKNYYVN